MRPILYSKNETRFDTYGLGEIDALKGNATRERNGNYSAYLEYPASGPLASVFEKEMKFKADAGTRTKNQTFEIVRVVKDSSSTIKIYAQHISHKLEYMSVRHGVKVSGTADLALKTWAKNLVGDYHFDTWSDIDTVLPITFLIDKMENARLALGGVEGSILDIWGGEYEFDNQTVRLHKRLGRRAPTVLEYGRNILSAESDESIESAYTSVVPFATYTPESQEDDSRQQDPVLVTIPESYVDSKYVSMYANRRIKVVDFSSEFKDEGTGESKKKDIPTPEKLKALAIKYMENNRIGAPKINTKIEYVDLAQTLDYAERGWIEELELCDIVPVYYPEIGITEDDAKVTKVVYDFLNDRNESVEFGMIGESIRSAMTGGLAGRLDDLEKNQQSLENRQSEMAFELPKYLLDAKGNRVWNKTPDENIEHKVGDIWFEKNGLYQRLYIWNGEMWEKRIDTEDVSKVVEKFDAEVKKINQSMATQTQQTTQSLRIAGANASAIEAAKGAITKLNQDLTGAKQTNQAAIDRLKSDFANAQKTANDQTALLRSDLANIRTKQSQAESEIAKQVQALNATKTELVGVKSAQANYEQTTTRRLAELANVADGKASKSELVQTATELNSKIASVQASGRNLFLNSLFKQDIRKTGIWTTSTYTAVIDSESKYLGHNALKIIGQDPAGKDGGNPKITYPATGQYGKVVPGSMSNQDVTISFYAKAENAGTILRSRLGNIWFKDGNVTLTTEVKRYVVKFSMAWTGLSNLTTNEWLFNLNRADTVWIWMPKFEVSDTDTPYSEAPEDVEGLITAVESTFKQKADSIEAGVTSLREGLKTKADSSALTLLSDRISASVKSLETDTQNKLNQKLSTAEFDVRANRISQEIINATKDKADKALVTAEAGRLREELASQIGSGRNLWINSKISGSPVVEALPAGHITGQKQCYKLTNNQELLFNIEPDFSSRLFRKITFSAWIKYENVVRGANNWNAFNCFKHYMFLKNSKTGTVSGASYLTLAGYDGTSDWKRIIFTYDYSANKGYDQLKTLLKFNLEGVRSGTAWITGVQVEFGGVANEYAPALEDVDNLITEAKSTFERTAHGLRTDLSEVQAYVNTDGSRAEALRTFSREETARQMTALRQSVEAGYVAKAQHTEDVRGLTRRFEELNSGGPNLVSNGATELGLKNWSANGKLTADRKHSFFKNSTAAMFVLDTSEATIAHMQQNQYNVLKRNTDYTLSFTAFASSNVSGFRALVGLLSNMDHAWKKTLHTYTKSLSPTQAERITVQFNSGDFDGFALRFDNMGSSNGRSATVWISEIDIYEGTMKRPYQPSPANSQSYADTKLAEYKQNIDGQLATVQAAISTANGSLTSFNTWKQTVQETLNKVGRVETGLNETKTSLAEFKRTAEGQLTTITQQVAGKASQTDFQRVQETSKLYERLIGSTEKEITDKVSRMALTNELFQVEVSKNLDLRTVQYQMVNAWAVQNLNSNGDIISQINMTGPNVRIQGESIHLDGKTLIDNGIIKNAMIESMLADKITAGTLNAANVNIINLNASKIVGLDANFIKSKIELAFIEWMRGKTISAQNDAMQINLNDGHVLFYNDDASIKRVLAGYPTQFIRYENKQENGQNHGRTIIGSNRNGSNVWKSASFAGLVIDNNSNNSVDKIYQFGDYNHMRHAQGDDGWNFSVVTQAMTPGVWNKNSEIWARHFVVPRNTKGDTDSPTQFIRLEESVAAIWNILNHAASGQVTMTQAMKNLINSRKAAWDIVRNVG